MILDEGESRVLLNPKIYLVKLDDEIECKSLELVFKEVEDLVGVLNKASVSSFRWWTNLEEEHWEGELLENTQVFFYSLLWYGGRIFEWHVGLFSYLVIWWIALCIYQITGYC